MKLNIPTFKTQKELFQFIVDNEELLITQKKSEIKLADGVGFNTIVLKDFNQTKSTPEDLLKKEEFKVTVVINTTNIMDSHKDVHIPGLWDKSLQENKRIMHIQEHKSHEFDKIISSGNDLKAYTKSYTWKQLGLNAKGKTEALMFDSNVKKERNPYMHEQYAKGFVDNHSVGMQYVKLITCINDEDYPVQKENWDKYFPEVINGDVAEKSGIFWAILEAKAIEGSAVPSGSNPITPTLAIKNEVVVSEQEKGIRKFLDI